MDSTGTANATASRSAARPTRGVPCAVAGLVCLLLAVTALGGWAPRALALSSDREKQIEIEADSAEADEKERVTIYRGDAVITQGTLRITGDTVWIYFNEDYEFVKLVSEGKPAHMQQQPDGQKELQMADANRLEYYADKNLIVLLGNAVYGMGEDRISAERIEYDSLNGRMKATGNQNKRIKIQIMPRSLKKKKQDEQQ